MSLRSAVRGIVLAAAGAAIAVTVAALLSPAARRAALSLVGRRAEPDPQQPTHIVLPDRMPESDWTDVEQAVEDGRGDVALTAGA